MSTENIQRFQMIAAKMEDCAALFRSIATSEGTALDLVKAYSAASDYLDRLSAELREVLA